MVSGPPKIKSWGAPHVLVARFPKALVSWDPTAGFGAQRFGPGPPKISDFICKFKHGNITNHSVCKDFALNKRKIGATSRDICNGNLRHGLIGHINYVLFGNMITYAEHDNENHLQCFVSKGTLHVGTASYVYGWGDKVEK